MTLNKFIDGLLILKEHHSRPDGYHLAAEHDIFYVMAPDKPLSAETIDKLIELGWFQEGRSRSGTFQAADHSPDEPWAAFT